MQEKLGAHQSRGFWRREITSVISEKNLTVREKFLTMREITVRGNMGARGWEPEAGEAGRPVQEGHTAVWTFPPKQGRGHGQLLEATLASPQGVGWRASLEMGVLPFGRCLS